MLGYMPAVLVSCLCYMPAVAAHQTGNAAGATHCAGSTCVTMAFAFAMRRRVAISAAAKESAMATTTQPASTIPKYATTASAVIGMSMATASPGALTASHCPPSRAKLVN